MLERFNAAIANITFNLNDDKQDTEIENIAPSIDCKYYTINELNSNKLDPNKNFYINLSKYTMSTTCLNCNVMIKQ